MPISALVGYGGREQTHTDHLRLVTARSGWITLDAAEWKELEEFLLARAVVYDADGGATATNSGKKRSVSATLVDALPETTRASAATS